ncbi:MAG: lysophospholipid acyltransferase family protein [bacterium]
MRVQESFLRDISRIIIWYPGRWLVRLLPITWSIRLFRCLGRLHAQLSKGRKNHLIEQYNLVFNPQKYPVSTQPFVQDYLINHYQTQLSIFFFPKLKKTNIDSIHSFSGLDHLDRALEKESGAILLHAHFGPAQLTLVALGLQGYPMLQIGLPSDAGLSWIGRKVSYRLRQREESKIPAQLVPADGYLRPVVKGLHHNRIIMTTADGAGGGKYLGKFVALPFLGKPFPFSLGAMQLADRIDTPILPIFLVPINKTQWQTVIYPPLPAAATMEQELQPFIVLFESYMLQYPGLWHFWDEIAQRLEYAQQLSREPKNEKTEEQKNGSTT